MAEAALAGLDGDGFGFQLVRAMRNGLFFAIETRVPYGIANIGLRDLIFPAASGRKVSLSSKLDAIVEGSFQHGWVLARIAFIFRAVEEVLRRATSANGEQPRPWHSFVAGCVAGYRVMALDRSQHKLKQQVNMFIGMRTAWALGRYALRQGYVPSLERGPRGHDAGWAAFVTLTWGIVMWHWRHEDKVVPGEMPPAMARSMDYIYAAGDRPGRIGWFTNAAYVTIALAAYRAVRKYRARLLGPHD